MRNTNKKVAILQSNYIPWKGYFDMIARVDEFILYDDMQYTKRDWRNRNKIKTANGLSWLTIPVEVKGKFFQKISDTLVSDKEWSRKHWDTILGTYSKAPFFKEYKSTFENLYNDCSNEKSLSKINFKFIEKICAILSIDTKISWSSDYGIIDGKTERLVDLCVKSNATEYISGPAAKDYVEEELFAEKNIKLLWMDYSNYPEYPQLYDKFEHGISILDLIFNLGLDSVKFMKHTSKEK